MNAWKKYLLGSFVKKNNNCSELASNWHLAIVSTSLNEFSYYTNEVRGSIALMRYSLFKFALVLGSVLFWKLLVLSLCSVCQRFSSIYSSSRNCP
jgi:hypothetical protein